MKKNNLNKLSLNKKVISDLNAKKVTGGQEQSISITILSSTICVASALTCTRWDGCDMPTIGSGDGPNCYTKGGR